MKIATIAIVATASAWGAWMAVDSLVFVDLGGKRIVSECGHCGSSSVSFTPDSSGVYCWKCKKITLR